jgi:hypothetical protein
MCNQKKKKENSYSIGIAIQFQDLFRKPNKPLVFLKLLEKISINHQDLHWGSFFHRVKVNIDARVAEHFIFSFSFFFHTNLTSNDPMSSCHLRLNFFFLPFLLKDSMKNTFELNKDLNTVTWMLFHHSLPFKAILSKTNKTNKTNE